MSSAVLLPLCKPLCDITLSLESSRTAARAVGDGGELTFTPVFEIGPLLQVPENSVALVRMRADDASAALFLLILQGVDVGFKAVKLPLQGGEVVDCVKIASELSGGSPVPHLEGPGDDCVVARGIGDGVEEPLGVVPVFVDGEALRGEEFLTVDGLVLAIRAQAVLSVKLDEGGEDVDGMGAVSNRNKEVGDVPFVLLISLRLPLVIGVFPEFLIAVRLPVLVGFFQASRVLLTLCQSVCSFFEGSELGAVGLGIDLILSCNSSQSSGNEDEFFPAGAMSLESGACGARGKAQLTEIGGRSHHFLRDDQSVLFVPSGGFAFEENGDWDDVQVRVDRDVRGGWGQHDAVTMRWVVRHLSLV